MQGISWRKSATMRFTGFLVSLLLWAVPAVAQDNDVDAAAHFKDAMKAVEAQDYDKALKELAIARKATPEADDSYKVILKWQGFIHLRAGKFQDAIEPLKLLTDKDPKDAEALLNLGNAYEGLGDTSHPDAIKTYLKAAEVDKKLADPHFNLGNLYYKKRDYPNSIKYYKNAANLNKKDSGIPFNLGHTYFASFTSKTDKNALEALRNALDAYSTAAKLVEDEKEAPAIYKAKLYRHVGIANLYVGRETKSATYYSAATTAFKRSIDLNGQDIDARMLYGEALIESGEPEKAAVQFLAAQKIDDNRYEAHYNRGQALSRKTENIPMQVEAALEFKRALELASNVTSPNTTVATQTRNALQGLAIAQMNSKSPETEKTFQRLTTEFPQFGEAWTNLALARAKNKDIDGAIDALQKGQASVTSAKEQAKILRALGAFYIEKATKGLKPGATGDTALIGKAQEAFNKSLTLESDMPDAYHGLGLAASWLGQLPDAIKNFERAIRLKPTYAAAYNDLGAVYVAQKNKAQALKAFQKAIDLEDNQIYRDTYVKNLEELKNPKKN